MGAVLRADLALTMDPTLGVVVDPVVAVDDDGRIREIASAADASIADEEVHDLRGHWLLPGLVNCHNHAAMALLRGFADDLPLQAWLEDHIWPVERRLDADIVRAGTLLAAVEMLAGGVTTWADMYFHMDAVAEAVVESGGRARLAPGILDALGPVQPQIEHAAAFARRWHGRGDGRIRVDLGPHAPYTVPPASLVDVAEAARELGVGLQIHLAETAGEVERAQQTWGRSPTRHLEDLGVLGPDCLAAHAVWLDDDDIRILAATGTAVAHNARSNMRLASGIAPVPALLEAGVTVGLGTDGAASTTQLTLFEELRAAAMLAKVTTGDPTALDARTSLQMATIGGARALRWDDEIGSLTPGKRADVVAIATDRLALHPVHDVWSTVAHAVQDADVARVYVDGKLVAEAGRPVLVDGDAIRADGEAAARRLVGDR